MMWRRRRERKVKWRWNKKEHWKEIWEDENEKRNLKRKMAKGKTIREKRIRRTLKK